MNVECHSTPPAAAGKSEMVSVSREALDRLRRAMEEVFRLGPSRSADLSSAIGTAAGLLDCIVERSIQIDDSPPLALYDPPFVINDDGPGPDELAWAAEHLAPAARPTGPAGLLRYIADALEALGLEPTVAAGPRPLSIGLMAWGREYGLELQDRTDYYQHMDRASREYDREQQERRDGLAVAGSYGYE